MKCNMPINQGTKIALAGEALEAALKDPSSPRCGQELAADDVFCSACGARVGNNSSSQGAFVSCNSGADALEQCMVPLSPCCQGRASRREVWQVVLIATLVYVLVLVVTYVIVDKVGSIASAIQTIASFIIGIYTVPVSVRRLHDLGYSGKAIIPSVCFSFILTLLSLSGNDPGLIVALLGIIAAVYNLILFVLLGFIRGTKGPNRYGPDPLETK